MTRQSRTSKAIIIYTGSSQGLDSLPFELTCWNRRWWTVATHTLSIWIRVVYREQGAVQESVSVGLRQEQAHKFVAKNLRHSSKFLKVHFKRVPSSFYEFMFSGPVQFTRRS